jgi:hypothetical protein
MMRGNQAGIDRRKVSLTFLTNCNNLKIPEDFFNILEDIRNGLYPRLFSNDTCDLKDTSTMNFRAIAPSTCLDFVIEQKKIIDRRSSVALFTNDSESFNNLRRGLFRSSEFDIKEETSSLKECYNNLDVIDDSAIAGSLKYPLESRRLVSETCELRLTDETDCSESMIELCVDLKFNDGLTRHLQSYFPIGFLSYLRQDTASAGRYESSDDQFSQLLNSFVQQHESTAELLSTASSLNVKMENICMHLANELIDNGLINPKDHNVIFDLFYRTIRDYLAK